MFATAQKLIASIFLLLSKVFFFIPLHVEEQQRSASLEQELKNTSNGSLKLMNGEALLTLACNIVLLGVSLCSCNGLQSNVCIF